MCGVFGAVSRKSDVAQLVVKGISALSYRGYDSSGICLLKDQLYIEKTLGPATNLPKKLPKASLGIGHSRWATHGPCTLENAHPHKSKGVAIVHNGIIQNHLKVKKQLTSLGYRFSSQTDSEVIAHLLHHLLEKHPPMIALEKMQKSLDGRFAFLAIIQKYPDRIFALSKDLPLTVGMSTCGVAISSDLLSLQHCHGFKRIQDCPFELFLDMPSDDLVPMIQEPSFCSPALQENITLQEIYQQPQLIDQLISTDILAHIQNIPKSNQFLIIACGSSYHCALIFKHWLMSLGIYAFVEVASELKTSPLPNLKNSLVIAISQSGETADTLIAVKRAIATSCLHSIAITNSPRSTLAEISDTVIDIRCGPEVGVASTKAVTNQIIVLYALYLHLANKPILFPKSLGALTKETLALKNIALCAQNIATYSHILCLGKNKMLPIAKEFALKLKELTYIHAEALPAGELKHGPLALIDTSVLCIIIDDGNCPQTLTSLSEIQARGGPVLHISPSGHLNIPYISGDLSVITINVACQLLAYYTAKALGRPIDKPRNLAKSVTVE